MVGWKSSPHIDAHIRFDADQDSKHVRSPTFNGNEQITGVATFSLKKNYEDIRYRVLIKGIVETKTQEYPPGGLNSASSIETHTFLSATMFDGSANASSTSDSRFRTKLPFRFALQNASDSVGSWGDSRINGEIVQEILPSMTSRGGSRHWSDSFKPGFNGEFRITYTVIASAYANRKMVASTSRDFVFLPTSSPPPPVPVEDFADEYALRASKTLQKTEQNLRIGIVSQEPSALGFKVGGKGSSTNVNLFIMLFRPHTRDFDASELPQQLRVQAKLRTTTFVMPKRSKPDMHTLTGAMNNKDAAIKQEKTHAQNYTMALNSWETNESESEDDKSTISEEVFSTAVSVPFVVEGEHMPSPTFYSPLLSRRYAVDLSLTFDDQPGSGMKLRLPLQVFYRSGV